MNLYAKLQAQAAAGRPVRAGLIGAGKFGSMFLSQVPTTPGLEVTAIADLAPERARAAMASVGWDAGRAARTAVITSGAELAARDDVDVVIEATGDPEAGILHARAAIAAATHIVMVNVEADVLAGPLLAEQARAAGVVYSMAYGDQPALVAELSTGSGQPDSSWWRRARAPNTSPAITGSPRTRSGTTTASAPPRPRRRA